MPSLRNDLEVHIREALISDAQRICALAVQLRYQVPVAHVERFLAGRSADRELFVAIVPRVGVVGWIGVCVRATLTSAPFGEVEGLVVDQEYRGANIGLGLLQRAEAWSRARECITVRLRSNVIRERAHGFYVRNGYEVVKTQHLFEKRL
ncbi:MAG TPA: GNAT family N-acetyltransferase [Candidatus Baltobacteraceae bacterium]|jgi:GNAT superfamily N-acetyltransferase